MADLTLKIHGEDHASEAFHGVGHAAGELKEGLEQLGLEIFAVGETWEKVSEFFKESVKDFAELQRSQMQLKLVAGELTEEFVKQGEEFEKHYAISLKTSEAMQTMMLRFGTAPAAVKPATQAILDYAAATGHDAEQATQAMMRAVERGADGVKALGITYVSTGDQTKDLALATAELEKKYGGAADTERAGLTGSLRAVKVAQEHVHEAFGSMLATLDSKLHILEITASVFERIAHSLEHMDFSRFEAFVSGIGSGGVIGGLVALVATGKPSPSDEEGGAGPSEGLAGGHFRPTAKALAAAAREGNGKGAKDLKSAFGSFDDYGQEGQDKRFQIDQKYKDEELALQIHNQKMLDLAKKAAKDEEDFDDAQILAEAKRNDTWLTAAQKQYNDALEDQTKEEKRLQKLSNEAMARATADARKQAEEEKRMWESIGQQTGKLFIDAIGKELNAAIAGDGSGGGSSFRRILGDVVQGALSIVFSAFLGPEGGAGINASHIGDTIAGNEDPTTMKNNSMGPSSHDGSWIQKFHSGGWPSRGRDEQAAVLQVGERVLSKAEVARMGGRQGVDRAAGGAGGRGMSVTVQAFDTVGVRAFFGDRGGRGMVNALRVGRGDIVPLLGRG